MPINATFVYKVVSFVVQLEVDGQFQIDSGKGYRNVNVVEYVIIKIFKFLAMNGELKEIICKSDDE